MRDAACRRIVLLFLISGLCWVGSARPGEAAAQTGHLQERIQSALPGETIVLEPGIYEGPITIDRPIVLQAAEKGAVILRNAGPQPALKITADQAAVSGLRIEDESVKESPTVLVTGKRASLKGLNIRTGSDGIAIRDADGVQVSATTIAWTAEGIRMADKGNGIDLYHAHQVRLTGNLIRNVHDGIYIEKSDGTIVTDNRIEESRYGVHCMYTRGTRIQGNEGHRNVTGAMIMAAQEVKIGGNTFSKQNENVHSQGILLFDAHGTVVSNNRVEGNRVGLYVEQSTDNHLADNDVLYNYIGLQLLEAENNRFTGNRFLGNVADAEARGSRNNDLNGNDWDFFSGLDADGDGRSDLSYAINPFFMGLAEKKPAFQLFFQSPGMVFLEGLYQADDHTWTTDSSPLMGSPETGRTEGKPTGGWQTGLAGLLLFIFAGTVLLWTRRRII